MMDRFFDDEKVREAHDYLLHLVRHGQNSILDDFLTNMKTEGTPCDLTITNSAGESLIETAAKYNRLSTIKILLRHGAPYDRIDDVGLSSIMLAKYHKNVEMVRLLENPEAFLSEQPQEKSANRP